MATTAATQHYILTKWLFGSSACILGEITLARATRTQRNDWCYSKETMDNIKDPFFPWRPLRLGENIIMLQGGSEKSVPV
jgi:hypothetical protein